MKILLAVCLLAGCGTYYKNPKINLRGKPGNNGSSCATRQESTGVYVECTDGSISFIPFPKDGVDGESVVGPAGESGPQGLPGEDAVSCTLVERNVTCHNHTKRYKSYLVCPNGELYLKDVKVSNGC